MCACLHFTRMSRATCEVTTQHVDGHCIRDTGCALQAVAVQGRHLQTADLSVVSLSELAVYNIRRLFANRQTEFMALQQASDDQKPRLRRIRNATMD